MCVVRSSGRACQKYRIQLLVDDGEGDEVKPWRNSVPAEIDLFDKVTVKPTGTIMLKPPWL